MTRPTIAGLMGAFGAALAARDLHLERSALLSEQALASFTHTARPVTCNLCTNHCSLTVNSFDGGRLHLRQPLLPPPWAGEGGAARPDAL